MKKITLTGCCTFMLLAGSMLISCQDKSTPPTGATARPLADSLPAKQTKEMPVAIEGDTLPNRHFGKSEIINPKFAPQLLFGMWAEKDSPACDFTLDKEKLFLCDMEGDSDRLYRIVKDSIFLDNPTLIFKGRIVNVTKDSLIIHWQENEKPQVLLRWKD